MDIHFKADGRVTLENAEDFRSFKAVCERSDATVQALARSHSGLVRALEDADHIWLDVEGVAALAPPGPEWKRRYDGMIAYAAKKGWTRDNAAQVAAHVVWERQDSGVDGHRVMLG